MQVFVSSDFSLILLSNNLQQRLAVIIWHEWRPDTEAVTLSNQKAALHLTFWEGHPVKLTSKCRKMQGHFH